MYPLRPLSGSDIFI